ncbi:MAG: tandem-95 repeat protein [Pirellulaceae bacterium]
MPNGVLTGASDPDGGPGAVLTVVSVGSITTQAGGTVVISPNGQFVYTPRADYSGPDVFTYTVRDSAFSTNSADVLINVIQQPDAPRPTAVPLVLGPLTEDGGSDSFDLDTAFTDPDLAFGDQLIYRVVSVSDPSVVNASVNGPLLSVSPLPNASGSATVVVEARDSTNRTAQRQFTVIVNEANDPPQLIGTINDLVVSEDNTIAGISLNNVFRDPDGETLTIAVVANTNPDLISTEITTGANPQLRLSLADDASGQATITIRATDGSGFSVTEQFTVTVNPVPDAPTAVNDLYPRASSTVEVKRGGTFQVTAFEDGLLANDFDGDGDSFVISGHTQPRFGTLTVNATTGGFTYTNTSGATGTIDSFEYTIRDSTGRTDTATVSLVIGNPLLSHHNVSLREDVNADGTVSPIDALMVINLLNRQNVTSIPVRSLETVAPPFFDVNGDANVTAVDALIVINELNRLSSLGFGGEGESDGHSITENLSARFANNSVSVGRGVVNAPILVTPKPSTTVVSAPLQSAIGVEEAADSDDMQFVDVWSDERFESVLDVIVPESKDDEETDFADSFDAAIDQLLGINRLDE